MPVPGKRSGLALSVAALCAACPAPVLAQSIAALPDQTSRIRLSNRDVNHVVCVGGEIEDVKFSAEKGIAVERGGSDAWIKFLVKEVDEAGMKSRNFVTTAAEFYVACNGAIYPLYAEPADIPAQTVTLVPGASQRARSNDALLGPLVEEERVVSITLALLQDRVPGSFTEVAPGAATLAITDLPDLEIRERRRLAVEGSGLTASEYLVTSTAAVTLDERAFLDSTLGADIFAVTLDRLNLAAGDAARLIVIRRSAGL
ncbi:type-F conjugative transfer system secretin TraK [Sphingomonas sp. MG17]|uniref:Type-F conjugative transfer system secretin TraK n=1 Tax=Sphingomonas tagetis TaxID=2949092 RepID=A0A9X2KNE0_9SPHN|nr:type-F conjugative transfer system secretin TraK [Sphingomonas tagetis]MCP3732760.1 type-F conjugative transfer system secretin TraK [Sphingomonas tagetis]